MEGPVITLQEREKAPQVDGSQPRKLRASSYIIFVDLPENGDTMLLVHGYSGAYDLVSRKVATFIRSLEVGKAPRPLYGAWTPAPPVDGVIEPPSERTIALLKRRGYLTRRTVAEEEALFITIANQIHARSLRAQPTYILMPTYDCNLRCSYCFQDYMRTNPGYAHLLHTMPKSTVDRIVKGMQDIETNHDIPPPDRYARNITFFGGEPLLARNRPLIAYIIEQVRGIGNATFSAISNATELEAYQDLLNPAGIRALQVTIDGPAAEHDQRRIYADGSGSFARIASNVTMALEQGVQIQVRMNIDRLNIQFLPQLAEEIIARRWETYPNFSAYTAPIHASSEKIDVKTTFNSWTLAKTLNEMRLQYPALRIIKRPDDSLKDMARRLIESQGTPVLHSQFCGAHAGMYVIDPFANVYACWERTGDATIRIGHINREGKYEIASQLSQLWRSRNVTTNKICRQCRYALNCGGGCAVLAEGGSQGTIFTNYCDGYAARFRASVAEAYLEHMAGTQQSPLIESVCQI